MTRPTLIAAVLADPDALWAILTADVKVAGPWERRAEWSVRKRPDGNEVVEALFVRTAWDDKPWTTRDGSCAYTPSFATRAEAEAWCDEQLRKAGWLLATEEPA